MQERFSEEYGYYVDTLIPAETGLAYPISVCIKEAYNDNLGPRFRILLDKDYKKSQPIFLDNINVVSDQIKKFIALNKELLLQYWNKCNYDDLLDSITMTSRIIKI